MGGMCPRGFSVAVKGAMFEARTAQLWSAGGGSGRAVGGDTNVGEEMGELEVDSCARVNRRSLCVLPTKICD